MMAVNVLLLLVRHDVVFKQFVMSYSVLNIKSFAVLSKSLSFLLLLFVTPEAPPLLFVCSRALRKLIHHLVPEGK